jgi:hypothetical protein
MLDRTSSSRDRVSGFAAKRDRAFVTEGLCLGLTAPSIDGLRLDWLIGTAFDFRPTSRSTLTASTTRPLADVHASTTDFYIPNLLAASTNPVSTQNICIFRLYFKRNTVPVGFCWGGFTSTAGYVPGNEAPAPKRLSGITPFWLYLSKRCCSFLSEQLERS